MSLVIHIFHLPYCILLYTGSSSVNWLAVSCILPATLWDTGFKYKSCTQFMCLIINHFVTVTIMYYSSLQINYMVTVFIRKLLLFRLYVCFHVLNVLFACVFSNTDTVFWLLQIKVMLQQPLTCDSSFMLPTCFPYSPPRTKQCTHALLFYIHVKKHLLKFTLNTAACR